MSGVYWNWINKRKNRFKNTVVGTGCLHRTDKRIRMGALSRAGSLPDRQKSLCVPGLNCYSCPGALGSCPIGSLQAVLGSRNYRFSFYIFGFLVLVGSLLGRFVCGWLCPFGLVQDLIYKIPFVRKWKNLPGHRVLVWAKYVILLVFVILLPLLVLDITGQEPHGSVSTYAPAEH